MWTTIIHLYNYTNFILEVESNSTIDYCMDDVTRGYTFVLSDDINVSERVNNNTFFHPNEGVSNEMIYKILETKEWLSTLTWHHKEQETPLGKGELSWGPTKGLLIHRGFFPIDYIKMLCVINHKEFIHDKNYNPVILPWEEAIGINEIYIRFENKI